MPVRAASAIELVEQRSTPGREPASRLAGSARVPFSLIAIVFATAALIVAGCSASPEVEEREYQWERLKAALDRSVNELEKERVVVRTLQTESARVTAELASEKAAHTALKSDHEKVVAGKQEADVELAALRKEHAKVKETHGKLEKMSQETLAELSELRQRHDSIGTERRRLEDKAAVFEKQVVALTKEVDDVTSELERTRDAVRVLQENGEAAQKAGQSFLYAEKKRIEEVAAAQKQQVVALSQELVDVRAELTRLRESPSMSGVPAVASEPTPESVLASVGTFVAKRYRKALNGEIAWDRFDVIVACTLGTFVVGGLLLVLLVLRHWKARRSVKHLQLRVDEMAALQAQQIEAAAERAAAASSAARARARQVDSGPSDRMPPAEFSPIMRSTSSAANESRRAPASGGSRRDFGAVRRVAENAASSAAPEIGAVPDAAAAGAATQAISSPGARKIIGAWQQSQDDESVSVTSQLSERLSGAGREKRAAAADVPEEDCGAQTQIISDLDIGGLLDSEPAPAPAPAKAKPAAGAAGAAPGKKKGGKGSAEEQELLNELKNIINKKFESI